MAEQRNKRVQIRFRKSEYLCMWDKARKESISVSEYVRKLILEDCKSK